MSLYILRTIANSGNIAAQFTLGWMYEHGDDDNDVAQGLRRGRDVIPPRRRPGKRAGPQCSQAATTAATANREAAEAWDALATHAAKHADVCRHGAELADRTRHRWAR